ncbi:mechanosensitive ion channel protein 10 isoform X2 [Coffea arabica]|uniref:Mechanosensitive ion channel protein n=1 Tax=Coffea arabica TaxID=13443 RepID=A0A6P6U1Q0_COFAR|nr:mechanosensitive ion channel protein 10-like isoform X3 [Coffea arabica]
MDANTKASKQSGEISMAENKKTSGEVVVPISGDEKDPKKPPPAASPVRASVDSPSGAQRAVPVSFSSPEAASYSPSANKPPKIPTTDTLTRRKSIARSVYSKPKSRFGEQSVPVDTNMFDEDISIIQEHAEPSCSSPYRNLSNQPSPNDKMGSSNANTLKETIRNVPITPKTPLMASPGGFGGADEDEEIYKKVSLRNKLRYHRVKVKVLIEWFVFACILGCFVASLTVHKLRQWTIWGLEIWKWCALVMVTVSGMLFTKWLVLFAVLLIELAFLLRKKVLYFVYALRKSVQFCMWLSLVLLTWVLLFRRGVERSRLATKILDYITWTMVTFLIGAFLWLLKTLLLKILASSFHVNAFFDRIQESVFHQYILLTLSGPPVMESAQMLGRANSTVSQFSFRRTKAGKDGKEKKEKAVIDINKLHQMKREKVTAWTMKMLVDVISNTGLTTFSGTLGESVYDGGNEQSDKEITNEEEAIAAAYHIFRNVAQPGCRYIDEMDLRRFMIKEEVDIVLPMIDVAETGQIDRKALTHWVMVVEEMNILTTVFLRYDNEKIYYPNSVLASKPISNFYRSPDMGDSLEFSIDFKTPLELIGTLKDKIKKYLEKNPSYWHPNHSVVVKEIENVNKIKMAIFFNHTMNFQDYGEKNRRRSELVLEIKRIFEELKIKYDLLPQEVHLVESKSVTTGSSR